MYILCVIVHYTENFSALTRLDHNRAVGQLALKSGADVEDVSGCIIWGNHSSTQYPDINSATIRGKENTQMSIDMHVDMYI